MLRENGKIVGPLEYGNAPEIDSTMDHLSLSPPLFPIASLSPLLSISLYFILPLFLSLAPSALRHSGTASCLTASPRKPFKFGARSTAPNSLSLLPSPPAQPEAISLRPRPLPVPLADSLPIAPLLPVNRNRIPSARVSLLRFSSLAILGPFPLLYSWPYRKSTVLRPLLYPDPPPSLSL